MGHACVSFLPLRLNPSLSPRSSPPHPTPPTPALLTLQVRVLQLGSSPADGTPRSFSCPDPPKCLKMGAPTADLPRRPVSLIP